MKISSDHFIANSFFPEIKLFLKNYLVACRLLEWFNELSRLRIILFIELNFWLLFFKYQNGCPNLLCRRLLLEISIASERESRDKRE